MIKRKSSKINRMGVALLAAIFFFNSVIPAEAQIAIGKTQIESGSLSRYLLEQTRLPENIAYTDEKFSGNSPEAIWILRDAHAVPDAQNSIRRAIVQLQKQARIQAVAVEGVTGDFHTAFFRAFPDQALMRQELKRLWSMGELSGPALAAITGAETDYFGAEDSTLYTEELNAYMHARATQPSFQIRLDEITREIQNQREHIFSKELDQFETNRIAAKKNEAQGFAAILEMAQKKLSGFEKEFPHLAALAHETKGASGESVRVTLAAWAQQVRAKAEKNKSAAAKWNAQEQLWQTSQISDAQFAAFALQFCRKQGWQPRLPQELNALAHQGQLLSRLRGGSFADEWNALLTALETKFATKKEERALITLIHQSELMSDWLRLELSREDWNKTSQSFAGKLENLRQELANSDFEKFYQIAEAREQAILKNTLAHLKKNGQTRALVVVGGFHADMLAAELKRRKISYAVLTPAINDIPAESRYDALMRGDVSWKNFIRTENNKIKLYESFARAMAHQLLDLEGESKDPTQALAYYKTWRENLMRSQTGTKAQENFRALALLDEIVLEAVYPNEYPRIRANWQKISGKIVPVMQRLKKMSKSNSFMPAAAATANAQFGTPVVSSGAPINNVALKASFPTRRSEFRKAGDVHNLVHASFEAFPYKKDGGLADVAGELPIAQKEYDSSANVSVVMPHHRDLKFEDEQPEFFMTFAFDSPEGTIPWTVSRKLRKGVWFYFLKREGLFNNGYNFEDDNARLREMAYFSKAVIEFLTQANEQGKLDVPDVLHAHDQMSALIPVFMRKTRNQIFENTASIYTAHHLAYEYQGRANLSEVWLLKGLGLAEDVFGEKWNQLSLAGGDINPTLWAFELANIPTTVSQGYLNQVLDNPNSAPGLSGVLNRRRFEIKAVENAVFRDDWDTTKSDVHARFSPDDLARRGQNKLFLSQYLRSRGIETQLQTRAETPLILSIGRISWVKGVHYMMNSIAELLRAGVDLQFLLLGQAHPKDGWGQEQQKHLHDLMEEFPRNVLVTNFFATPDVVRQFYAAADFFYMFSQEEPMGIAQLQAMLSGAPVLATQVGGLIHSVRDPRFLQDHRFPQTGWKVDLFHHLAQQSIDQLRDEINGNLAAALGLFHASREGDPRLNQMRRDGMASVEDWSEIAPKYFDTVYNPALLQQREYVRKMRSELHRADGFVNEKNFPLLSKSSFYSLQLEFGYSRHILEAIETDTRDALRGIIEKYNISDWRLARILEQSNFLLDEHDLIVVLERSGVEAKRSAEFKSDFQVALQQISKKLGIADVSIAQRVAQATLTGGLGALIPDLLEAWEANNLPIIGLHPLWNLIKNKPEKDRDTTGQRINLGGIAKKYMTDTGMTFEVSRTITDEFRSYAYDYDHETRNKISKVTELFTEKGHRPIHVRIYATETTVHKAPQFYFDAYYVDDDGKEIPLFGEVYDDDYPMREFHMAIFNEAAQIFIEKNEALKGNKELDNIGIIAHEVFVSLPFQRLKKARLMTVNHTVFRPGLFEADAAAYDLLQFPKSLRGQIVAKDPTKKHREKISISDYTASHYDLITGVGLVEHLPALFKNIIRWAGHKLRGWYDGLRRSTNGIFLPRWQSQARRDLMEATKKILQIQPPERNLPQGANDRMLFRHLKQKQHKELKKEFIEKNEMIGAADVAHLLIWLEERHEVDWLWSSLNPYADAQGIANKKEMINALIKFRENVYNYMADLNSESPKVWNIFLTEHPEYAALTQILMSDPIAANVRRQVPYKGPDKYEEILGKTLARAKNETAINFNHEVLFRRLWHQIEKGDFSDPEFKKWRDILANSEISSHLRKKMARVIIGGRTFDVDDAYARFLKIRFFSHLLGLEDRIAAIDNYNYHDAEIIARGAQAGIMLSDEDLEAASTFFMKVLANIGEVIGVFGGAVPEIWKILVKITKKLLRVLDKDGDPAMTHDQLRDELKAGNYQIDNGILIAYEDGSQSTQSGGKRRPSAESLLQALIKLRENRSNQETRRQRMYNVLASSPEVDMVTGQAQAHAYLIEQMLREKQDAENKINGSVLADNPYQKLAEVPTFEWKVPRLATTEKSPGGLMGMMAGLNALKLWEVTNEGIGRQKESRGEDAQQSLLLHSRDGSIFKYLLQALNVLSESPSIGPLYQAVESLQAQASKVKKDQQLVNLNLQAIELVDQFLVKAAGEWVEKYMSSEDPAELEALRQVLINAAYEGEWRAKQKQPWSPYLLRYLEKHPKATPVRTDNHKVAAFVFQKKNGKHALININLDAPSIDPKPGESARKTRATVLLSPQIAQLLGGEGFGVQNKFFQMVETKLGMAYRIHSSRALVSKLDIGIPVPLGFEVLEWRPVQAPLLESFFNAFQDDLNIGAVATLKSHIQDLRIPANRAAYSQEIKNVLDAVDADSATYLFSESGRKAIMTLILMTVPELLEKAKRWDESFYTELVSFRDKRTEFFGAENPIEVIGTEKTGALVLARKGKSGQLLFGATLFYFSQTDSQRDEKFRFLLTPKDLQDFLDPNSIYHIWNALDISLNGDFREREDISQTPFEWMLGVPFSDRFQLLLASVERPRGLRSEARTSPVAFNGIERKESSLSPRVLKTGTFRLTEKKTAMFAAFMVILFSIFNSLPLEAAEIAGEYQASLVLSEQGQNHFVPSLIVASMEETVHRSEFHAAGSNAFTAKLDLLDVYAAAHFKANPKTPLHLGFAIPYAPEIEADFLAYAAKIKALQIQYGSLIENQLTLLTNRGDEPGTFSTRVAALGVKILKLSRDEKERAQQINHLLSERPDVFAYGLEDLIKLSDLNLSVRHRAFRGLFTSGALLSPAVLLNMATAESHLTVEDVKEIPARYPLFIFGRDGLALKTILDIKLFEIQIQQLIATMA